MLWLAGVVRGSCGRGPARRNGSSRSCIAVAFALLLVLGPQLGAAGSDDCADGVCPANGGAGASEPVDLSWQPRTISVVLPCAGEEEYAKKTVQSVAGSVPGGSGGAILSEIVVVDDGSSPPLSAKWLPAKFQKKYNVKLVRHERAVGLMGAKSAGAAVATGDLVVFFDCHVAPQDNWYEEFLKASAANYRRIVVPVITDLDINTWKERNRGNGFAKCYLTWDVDFKWISSSSPYMPVLSGGLLGISRRWWNETGGYDAGMRGWGGENIDQSLRTWLCGGEIYSVSTAFVAHMWRSDDPRTQKKYNFRPMDPLINKARAALGWYGDYLAKVGEYPDMSHVGFGPGGRKPALDVSNLHAVRDRLQCKPFQWFLWRFRDIYVNGGLLPKRTFRLKDTVSGLCLTYTGPFGTHPAGRASARLQKCEADGSVPQRWHLGNQDPASGKCCNGLRAWNTDQCLTHAGNGELSTTVCDVTGRQGQTWRFISNTSKTLAPGQLQFGGQCLVTSNAAGQAQLSLRACLPKSSSPSEQGPWRRSGVQQPLETRLYEEALQRQPELFA
eukprot:TRINITY_DN37681_c0_g1_i1.p1 TRINITY_DN37681_c0_g1~~TRINITY_DN37681_c0_g1_i1.p1  ORF type:complete len:568 (+),score=109.02 TRINITY_DN37681_c0_g1_i1:36-1706(+)